MLGTNAFFVSLWMPCSLSSSNISLLWSASSVGVWEFPRDPGWRLSWHRSVRTRDLLVAGPMTYSSSCSWWQHGHSWQRVGSQLSNLTEKNAKWCPAVNAMFCLQTQTFIFNTSFSWEIQVVKTDGMVQTSFQKAGLLGLLLGWCALGWTIRKFCFCKSEVVECCPFSLFRLTEVKRI